VKSRKRLYVPILEGLLLVIGLVVVSPAFLAFINAFKSLTEIRDNPLALPAKWSFENFGELFSKVGLSEPMLNSFLMCIAVIGSLVLTGSMAAYSLTRRKMTSGPVLKVLFLAGLIIPFQVVMVPLLQQFRTLNIQTSYLALWLHYVSWGLPLCIFIYSGFVGTVPKELEEAATIDGCGPLGLFWKIVFPLLKPCTITIVIFWGLWIWNDYTQALVIMGPAKGQLAFVQLGRVLQDQYVKNWNTIFAGVVTLSAPVTLLYLLMQQKFEKGLTAGSVK